MSHSVQAAFDTGDDARVAVERLRTDGFSANSIEIRSSIPVHGIAEAAGQPFRPRAVRAALLGGLGGALVAFLVASLSALDYPIVGGGMPIVSAMPTGIITYEGTAMGAILATVLTVVFECRLRPRFRLAQGPLDEMIAHGRVLVAVQCVGAEQVDRVRTAFESASAVHET